MLADPRSQALVEQLRRPVAAAAEPAQRGPRLARVPRLRRQAAPGVPPRDGAALRQRHPRGPQRPRPADRRLHLRQRAPGAGTTASRTSTAATSAACRSRLDARRGLLGHGSILTVTSHADRTSPVVRGKWILDNLLGTPPPPPPPNVPALPERTGAGAADDHARADGAAPRQPGSAPAVTRRWIRSASRSRTSTPSARGGRATAGAPIDASGVFVDGTAIDGAGGAAPGAAGAARRSSSAT